MSITIDLGLLNHNLANKQKLYESFVKGGPNLITFFS